MASVAPKKDIVIVGGGITGLQTALTLLQTGQYNVTVVAQYLPGDNSIHYTSPWAGAHWRTHATAGPEDARQREWDAETYKAWILRVRALETQGKKGEDEGLGIRTGIIHWQGPVPEIDEGIEKVWWKDMVENFSPVPRSELPEGIQAGVSFTTIAINVPVYLSHIRDLVVAHGGRLVRRTLPAESLPQALAAAKAIANEEAGMNNVEAFVNATGLAARELVPDMDMYPIKGQTILVNGEVAGPRMLVKTKGNPGYVIPRSGSGTSILGGSMEKGNWDPRVDDDLTERILEGAKALAPELMTKDKVFDIVSIQCGRRPARKGGVRLEKEKINLPTGEEVVVVHAYGHAGGGYQNSIGSAREVLNLINL